MWKLRKEFDMRLDVREFFECLGHHAGVFLKGCVRTAYGVAVAGLVALAVYGFVKVPGEDGYIAVCDFVLATATMVVALSAMYAIGTNKKKGAKKNG